ncbi:Alpha/Beta hydrolase protein [Nemania abortiva]|nr:Alpha/Beta hydrolase protein [Nemania abortiva]
MKRGRASDRLIRLAIIGCTATGKLIETPLSALSTPVVDLGYASYEGYYNDTYDLNIWKSIRYAAPPTGSLRWQTPQPPLYDGGYITRAVDQPPLCPQTGAYGVPKAYGFNSGSGNEDCLYLNIYAAPNATDLPVLDGGGHSVFGAVYDPSAWMNTNNNGFIVVEIQYRLGAFGFLASPETRQHITKFGGDPNRITVGGESSGAASAVFHALAYGGEETGLFDNIIAASPYFPTVYRYSDSFTTVRYNKFVELAGRSEPGPNETTFDCLVAADTEVLQNASGTVSTTIGYWGSFAFLPVIDDDYIQERPAAQLLRARLSGKRVLVGNNANDGAPLFNPNISTRAEYEDFIAEMFPLFTAQDVSNLNKVYKIPEKLPSNSGTVFDTLGYTGPTAITQSGFATGIQQTVFNLAAETVFGCPAQWIAEAFSIGGKSAWRYQYSLTPSYHGADLNAYFSVGATLPSYDFRHAMQKILGTFIVNNTPVIPVADAMGQYKNASAPVAGNSINPAHMNLNTTGGDISLTTFTDQLAYYVRSGPGVVNTFNLANSFSWEGGRGSRCDFWRAVSPRVPQ